MEYASIELKKIIHEQICQPNVYLSLLDNSIWIRGDNSGNRHGL